MRSVLSRQGVVVVVVVLFLLLTSSFSSFSAPPFLFYFPPSPSISFSSAVSKAIGNESHFQ